MIIPVRNIYKFFLLIFLLFTIVYGIFGPPYETAYAAPVTIGTSTSASATTGAEYRKSFYDSTNSTYWSFYYNGSAIAYKYSTDGVTWNGTGTIAENTSDFSIWANGTTVYLATSNGIVLNVRQGTAAATSITWGSPVTASGAYSITGAPVITQDTNNKIWVAWPYDDGGYGASGIFARRSTNVNDITAWDAINTLSTDLTSVNIVPLTGGDIYAAWVSGTTLAGKKYTNASSSWDASATTVVSTATTDYSLVSDASGNIHLEYLSSGSIYYTKYSGTWSSAVTIQSGSATHPSITIDTASGDLYAFYANTNTIYYKKGVSPYALANWDAAATSLYGTGTNVSPSASYQTTGSKAFLSWTNGAASPYNVYFDNSIATSSGPATRYWINNTSGNWNDTANWSDTSGGTGGATVPVAGDTAIFDNAGSAHNGALTIDTAIDVATLDFQAAYIGAITQGANTITTSTVMNLNGTSLTAGADITASGTLTIGASKTLDINGHNLTVTGVFTNNGTLKQTGDETTVSLTNDTAHGTVEYSATSGTRNIRNWTYYNLKINGTGGTFRLPATATTTVNGDLDVTAGTLTTNDGTTNRNITVTGNVTIAGTLTANASTITCTGNWANSGTFTANTSTVIFNKASSTQTLSSGGVDAGKFFNNLTHSGTGTLQLITNNLDVNGIFTNSAGTFDSNNLNMNFAGHWNNTGTAIFIRGSGLFYFDGTTTLTDSSSNADDLGTLDSGLATITLGSSITATRVMVYSFNMGSGGYNLNLTGTGSPISVAIFNKGTNSTFTYTGTGSSTNIITYAYNNLTVAPTTPTTYSLTGNLTGTKAMSGNLTVNANATLDLRPSTIDYNLTAVNVTINGTLDASDSLSTIAVGGNWSNAAGGVFVSGSSTVNFTKSSGTQTLDSGGTGVGKIFNNITHSGAGILQLLTNNINIDGDFTNSAGTFDVNSRDMTVAGSWSNTATFDKETRTVTLDGGATGKTINGGASGFYTLTVNGAGGGWTLNTSNLTTIRNLNVTAGTLNTGTVSLGSASILSSATTITINGGVLIGGSGSIVGKIFNVTNGTFTAGSGQVNVGSFSVFGSYTHNGGTVDWTTNNATFAYYAYGSNILPNDIYHNINLYNSAALAEEQSVTYSLSGTTVAEGNLSLYVLSIGPNTLDISSNILTVNGDITINLNTILFATSGTINVGGNWINSGTFTPGSGIVDFTKSSGTQTLDSGGTGIGKLFNNLTHSGAGTLQLSTNALNIDGNFTNSDGVFNADGLNINMAKNWNISGGSFTAGTTPGTQTITFDSTNAAAISGSTTFNNLIMDTSVDGAKTITFAAGATQTINDTWTLDGSVGNVLALRSSVPDTAWYFVISGDMISGDYIDVSDSQNINNAFRITPGDNVTDSGNNNPGWNFFPPDAPTIGTPEAISVAAIRWKFTDVNPNEVGFKVYDATDTLKATCVGVDLTSCDEVGLSVNTEYSGRYVVSYNDSGQSPHSGTAASTYTLANVPLASTVNRSSSTSLKVIINVNGNSAATQFAISNEALGKYVQADGSNGDTAVWQDYATWGEATGITNTGLVHSTTYAYRVKARNGNNIETAVSPSSSETTLSQGHGSKSSKPTPTPIPSTSPSSQESGQQSSFRFNNDQAPYFSGDNQANVRILQNVLRYLGYFPFWVDSTGFYGSITKQAVFLYQKSKAIVASWWDWGAGFFGPRTRAALNEDIENGIIPNCAIEGTCDDSNKVYFPYDLDIESSGYYVTKLQERLVSEGFLDSRYVTGYFGFITQKAVIEYQNYHNIDTSQGGAGRVGPKTREILNN
ncbi:MAG: peptidoglycan-binding protein [Patescibacteria group bacterium]